MPEISIDFVTQGLIWFVVFLFSSTCHEGAHALVAKWGGDLTASSQVTLNPIPHIQRAPFGMVVVPILSYALSGFVMGWAKAPYDPDWSSRYPHRAARMALAGPAANLLLLLAAAAAIRAGVGLDFFAPPSSIGSYAQIVEPVDPNGIAPLLATVLSTLFSLNLLLGTLNLLPLPPLDGHVGVTILMSEERARDFLELIQNPNVALVGLIFVFTIFGRVFGEIFWPVVNLLYFPLARYG